MADKDDAAKKDSIDKTSDAAKKEADKKKEVAKKSESATKEEGSGFSAATFLQGTKEELDKVVWPSRQQLLSESLAVILMVTLSATVIYLVDKLFAWGSQQVF